MRSILVICCVLLSIVGCGPGERPLADYDTQELEQIRKEVWDEMTKLGKETSANLKKAEDLENAKKQDEADAMFQKVKEQGDQHVALLEKGNAINAILESRTKD